MIQGVSEAPQTDLVPRDGRSGSRRWRKVILKDPAVESLSSFIGIDGTNTTLNSGRIQINLKPLERAQDQRQRRDPAACSRKLAKVAGITLYMQPVQDLTVEDRVSRTQYQYTLEDPNADELNTWSRKLVAQAQGAAGAARRGQRSAEQRPARPTGVRPRHGLAPGHHAADHRQHALRRVRPAPSLDHVHAVEPVSRGAGSRSPRFQTQVPQRDLQTDRLSIPRSTVARPATAPSRPRRAALHARSTSDIPSHARAPSDP